MYSACVARPFGPNLFRPVSAYRRALLSLHGDRLWPLSSGRSSRPGSGTRLASGLVETLSTTNPYSIGLYHSRYITPYIASVRDAKYSHWQRSSSAPWAWLAARGSQIHGLTAVTRISVSGRGSLLAERLVRQAVLKPLTV